jgi:hypothetical protein
MISFSTPLRIRFHADRPRRLGRRARLVELDPAYVDVIIQRWQALTGGSAALAQQDARGSFEDPAERTENVMPA